MVHIKRHFTEYDRLQSSCLLSYAGELGTIDPTLTRSPKSKSVLHLGFNLLDPLLIRGIVDKKCKVVRFDPDLFDSIGN